jgi:prevent-host-death family protein
MTQVVARMRDPSPLRLRLASDLTSLVNMTEYSIYETKSRLSEVLRQVKARREIVITERGKRIARIVPYEPEDEETIDERMERWMREGRVTPAQAPPSTIKVAPDGKLRGALERFLSERGRSWEK